MRGADRVSTMKIATRIVHAIPRVYATMAENAGTRMNGTRSATKLLQEWRTGDERAAEELMRIVYDELHQIAARVLRRERPHHTLRPTDLVSEAFVRLADGNQPDWQNRLHFFAIAARNMRRVLVDHARKRDAGKRGAGARPITFDEDLIGAAAPENLLALDEAIEALARTDERKARVIELHYFGGLTLDEVAEVLEIHANTVTRDLRFAEAWLRRHLDRPS
jgi:RNA polymerase sigma-70 factor, ECF subfamily